MPTITLLGSLLIMLGVLFIAFTPKERIIQAPSLPASFGTSIAIQNSDGTMATGVSVPYAEPGKILKWDEQRHIYRWVTAAD